MPVEQRCKGNLGLIVDYVRQNGRSPAADFLSGCIRAYQNKFAGSFGALVRMGSAYTNQQRFKPLAGNGKPLWEFKEFDHRIYCARSVQGQVVTVVLLNGWVKDKGGRQEENEIAAALRLYGEYLADTRGGRR